ncbi:MAG: DCC1-like thiol-disulfide oxidoreductase family protein [Bdellovibrionota bacterium]
MSGLVEKFFFEENGWTGGQYCVFRVLLGIHLLFSLLIELSASTHAGVWFWVPLTLLGIVASIGFIFGRFDRLAAVVLAGLWGRYGVIPTAPHNSEPLLIYILLAHLEFRRVPLGLFDPDDENPAEPWRLPQPVHALIWFIAIFFYTFVGAGVWLGFDYPTFTRMLVVSPLALVRRFRPFVWCVQLFVVVYLLVALGDIVMSLVLVQLFLLDPAWIRGVGARSAELIFYDGDCGLCHRFVVFVLREDRSGERFRFAPLGSKTFLSSVPDSGRANLPDSIVVLTEDGRVLTKSRAVVYVLRKLGGLWRVGAFFVRLVPRFIADAGYDLVARFRKQFFAHPSGACPLLPAVWQQRILPE